MFASPNRLVSALLAIVTIAVAVGLVAFWPGEGRANVSPVTPGLVQGAEVVSVSREGCEQLAGPDCRLARVVLTSGRDEGARSYLTMPSEAFAPELSPGDRVRVQRNGPLSEDVLDDPSQQPFAFVDFERSSPLLALVLVFAALVVVLGRWHGVRALLGLGISLAIVVEFLAPAILDGSPPLAVALVGSLAVMVVTIGISHGAGLKSMAAMLGTAVALGLTASLALLAVRTTEISGFSSEQSTLLLSGVGGLSLQGLVVAGIVVGALGVLDDVTVSQASTVLALRRANPVLGFRRLFGEAIDGRPRPPRRDRQHARARLRRRRAARTADLQHAGDARSPRR